MIVEASAQVQAGARWPNGVDWTAKTKSVRRCGLVFRAERHPSHNCPCVNTAPASITRCCAAWTAAWLHRSSWHGASCKQRRKGQGQPLRSIRFAFAKLPATQRLVTLIRGLSGLVGSMRIGARTLPPMAGKPGRPVNPPLVVVVVGFGAHTASFR